MGLLDWLGLAGQQTRLANWLKRERGSQQGIHADTIPDALWHATVAELPFLAELPPADLQRLRALAAEFLEHKEFFGANDVEITDAMGVLIAAQACFVLLYMSPAESSPRFALRPYQDFVGIVVQPNEVVAKREWIDEAGVVHQAEEPLLGEAAEEGPIMLSWSEVQRAGASAEEGTNVVIHEFVHKLAMKGPRSEHMPADCPPLPSGMLGSLNARDAIDRWFAILVPAFEAFQDRVEMAERFGQPQPWLDPYGADSLNEFFPVACEAYFVNRRRFEAEFPMLMEPFDALFRPHGPTASGSSGAPGAAASAS